MQSGKPQIFNNIQDINPHLTSKYNDFTSYRKTTLDNGVRVITETVPYVQSISIGIWVHSGSRFEQPEVNGICHFIEHMLFKGTDRRSAFTIAKEIDSVGGVLNAFTSKETHFVLLSSAQ